MKLHELFDKKPIPLPPSVKTMYHCTLARHMDSILRQGLIASQGQNYPKIYNHPGSKDITYEPGVWLATTPDYSQSWIHDIAVDYEPAVILEVNVSSLDQSKFIEDPFIPGQGSRMGGNRFAYLYQDSIPKSNIKPWGAIHTYHESYGGLTSDDGNMSGAYYGGKQVRQIQDAKEWRAFFNRIRKFFGLPDVI